jgi:hypothetical protein
VTVRLQTRNISATSGVVSVFSWLSLLPLSSIFIFTLSEYVPKTPKSVVLEEIARRTGKSLRTIQRDAKKERIAGVYRDGNGRWVVNLAAFEFAGIFPRSPDAQREFLNNQRLRWEVNLVLNGITEDDLNTPRDILKERDPEKFRFLYRTALPEHPFIEAALKRGVFHLKTGKLELNKPDFTLDDLARELGISRRTLYRRCSSPKWPTYDLKQLRKICPIVRKRQPLIGDGKLQHVS